VQARPASPQYPQGHGVTLRGRKPLPAAYPKELKTIGDHIRKRRLDLELRQRDVAQLLGVHVATVTNWELGRGELALRHLPGLVAFLGYGPVTAPQGSLPIPQRLRTYR
jgi:DNA-binding XRE family transcriptional regulator